MRGVHHDYSDVGEVEGWEWRCYTLEEVLAEKIRATLGQRKYAISRDLYDIYTLSGKDLNLDAVESALPGKVAARDIEVAHISADRMLSKKDDFEDDWYRNLIPLVPEAEVLGFAEVWQRTTEFVRRFTPIEPSEASDAGNS